MKSIVDYTNKLKDFFASKQALTNVENSKAAKTDITDITRTGAIGDYNTGSEIPVGSFFYLGDTLKQATSKIEANAQFTNSNCVDLPVGKLYKEFRDPLSNLSARVYKVGDIKVLYLIQPNSAMTYNVAYNCGTLPSEIKAKDIITTHVYGNSREYFVHLSSSGAVTVTCLTDTLPSGGKPTIYATVVYI